jgi:menaquinone-dependent protoporphyrinogen oxidase
MAKILAVYGTSHGQTAKVIERMARSLIAHGHRITIRRGNEFAGHSLEEFDAFLVAGSVHYGKHQAYLRDFVRKNAERLNANPSAFVSVSGSLIGTRPQGPAEAERYVTEFLRQTGWRPPLTMSVAGGLPYTKYGPIHRLVMRLISRFTGRPTDTSRDWEFTDWNAVARFAEELARLVEHEGASVTVRAAASAASSG